MKIRILDAEQMNVSGKLSNGDVVQVFEIDEGVYKQVNGRYFYSQEWKDKYFEIVEEYSWITWEGGDRPVSLGTLIEVKHRDGRIHKEPCGKYYSEDWQHSEDKHPGDIVAYRVIAEDAPQKPLKPHKESDPQYTQAAMLQKHLKQLSELENAIERHDNKQNKRRQQRQKLLEIINGGMPKRVKVVTDETLKPF